MSGPEKSINKLEEQIFKCHKCGAPTDIALAPPRLTVCENCCEDHLFEYDQYEHTRRCKFCGRLVDPSYYEENDIREM